jgi:KUP system potassium uptake protein
VAFLGANVLKIPAGGWLPLLVGAAIFTVMTTWYSGREHTAARRRLGTRMLEDLVTEIQATPRVAGSAVYLGADPGHVPSALEANLATHGVLHEHILVVTVQIADIARIPAERRTQTHDLGAGIVQVLLTFGFNDEPDLPHALHRTFDTDPSIALQNAIYVLGRETIAPSPDVAGMRLWRERLYALLHRNASSAVRYFRLPRDRIIEVGAVVEI